MTGGFICLSALSKHRQGGYFEALLDWLCSCSLGILSDLAKWVVFELNDARAVGIHQANKLQVSSVPIANLSLASHVSFKKINYRYRLRSHRPATPIAMGICYTAGAAVLRCQDAYKGAECVGLEVALWPWLKTPVAKMEPWSGETWTNICVTPPV